MRTRFGLSGSRVIILSILCLAAGTVARAEVLNAAPLGFTVSHRAEVPVPPAAAWEGLVAIGRWWDSNHTWSGQAASMSIEPRAGGCLCEVWAKGQVQHMVVIYAEPGRMLRLSGVLGPLQAEALAGTMTWTLDPSEAGGTKLEMAYAVGGHRAGGLEVLAPIVDGVLGAQVQRLVALLTTGNPVPPAAAPAAASPAAPPPVPGTGSGK